MAGRALRAEPGWNVIYVPSAGSSDGQHCEVALIDADLASGFLAALHASRDQLPRVVVLADPEDGARAAELVRKGAVGWVHRGESVAVLIETIHAVLRGEARLPQPLLNELLERTDPPAWPATEQPLSALLTPREMQILRMLEHGTSRAEIASYLHLSPNTVRSHVQHILNRLGVHSTLAAVARMRSEHASRPVSLAPLQAEGGSTDGSRPIKVGGSQGTGAPYGTH